MNYTKHRVKKPSKSGIQKCIWCKKIIGNSFGHWPPGDVFVIKHGLVITCTIDPIPNVTINKCSV